MALSSDIIRTQHIEVACKQHKNLTVKPYYDGVIIGYNSN